MCVHSILYCFHHTKTLQKLFELYRLILPLMNQNSFLFKVFVFIRPVLYPLALLYGVLIKLRNKLYDVKFFNSIEFSVPVICVGNLSTGGTGKTPHIEYLIELLNCRYRVATMSRGYKRMTQGFLLAEQGTNALRIGDEPMQFFMKYPEAVVCVAEERLTGIPNLLQRRPDVEVILLDDAYQHRSVKAGLNILITDYSNPFWEDHILPFGNLREGRESKNRADVIIVSKCPANLTKEQAKEIEQKIGAESHQQVFFTCIEYGTPYYPGSNEVADIKGKNMVLVSGIARPEPLLNFLKPQAGDVHVLTYPDHHYFVNTDIEEIAAAYNSWTVDNKIIVTTEKDATRLALHAEAINKLNLPIAVQPIKMSVLFNQANLLDEIVLKYIDRTINEANDDTVVFEEIV